MKEKGIIKLIKLLNKYLDDGQERLYACHPLDEDFDKFFHTKDGEGIIEEAQVISKKFGFIQRLVEHNKIDNSKFYDKNILKGFMTLTKEEKADSIIMNLSISDIPISDLISYLK